MKSTLAMEAGKLILETNGMSYGGKRREYEHLNVAQPNEGVVDYIDHTKFSLK